MRFAVVVLLASACSHHAASVVVTADAAIARDGLSCEPSGTCATGPMCGTTCCAANEACVSGTCMCGTQAACSDGNMCAAPLVVGEHCGDLCCGATSACPGTAGTP
jgi:hypothetical protein